MNAHFHYFRTRIVLAVFLSLLLHVLLWWYWHDHQAAPKPAELPTLQATLIPVPDTIRHLKPRRPKTAAAPAISPAAPSIVTAEPVAAPPLVSQPTEDLSAKRFADARAYKPTLPKRARLSYTAEYSGMTIGESIHEFEILNDRYSIHAETRTRGIVGLLKPYQVSQHSTGKIHPDGLQPEKFSETRIDGSDTQTYTADFNWAAQTLRFANGQTQILPDQTQDMLTLPYQLSQLPLTLETLPVASSNGRTLNRYFIAIGDETTITTPLGKLRTIPLRKVPSPDETGLIVWLALEYRLLPVKITLLDKSGAISANLLINDIRVSDE